MVTPTMAVKVVGSGSSGQLGTWLPGQRQWESVPVTSDRKDRRAARIPDLRHGHGAISLARPSPLGVRLAVELAWCWTCPGPLPSMPTE